MDDYKHIDELLADKLKGHAVRPGRNVWDSIAAEAPESRSPLTSRRIAAVLLAFLMALSGLLDPFNNFDTDSSQLGPVATASDDEMRQTDAQNEAGDFQNANEPTNASASIASLTQNRSGKVDNPLHAIPTLAATLADSKSNTSAFGTAIQNEAFDLISAKAIVTDQEAKLAAPGSGKIIEQNEFLGNTMAVASAKQQEEKFQTQDEWYVGTHGSIQHTSLLNGVAPGSNEDFDDQLNIGASYGLSLGYRLSNNISLETSLVVNSSQGAEYMDVARLKGEPIEVEKRLKLEYTQIPLSVKVKRWLGSSDGALNYVAGVQYGYLRASSFTVAGKSFTPEQRQRHDFALLLGLEYDYTLSDRFFMSAGVRGTYSANATSAIELDTTNPDKRNLVVGLRAGINYVLPGS